MSQKDEVAPVQQTEDPGRLDEQALLQELEETKRALEVAQTKAARYEILVENAPVGVFLAQDGIARFVNETMVKLTGYSRSFFETTSFLELIHPEDRQRILARHVRRLKGDDFDNTTSFRFLRPDKANLHLELISVGVRWGGRPATLNYIRDITHIIELEEELRRTHRVEAVEQLAGGVAHDLNNMVAAISGFLEVARRKDAPDEVVEQAIVGADRVSARARAFLRRVLDFTRKREVKRERVRVAPLVRDVLEMVGGNTPKEVEIHVDVPAGLVVLVDSVQLQQVALNLLTNAISVSSKGKISVLGGRLEACEPRPKDVVVGGITEGDYVWLRVVDEGPGIPAEIVTEIFQPFYTTRSQHGGTGLGLAIVRDVILLHDGALCLQSRPGLTEFTLFFQAHHAHRAPAPLEGLLPGGSEPVLIVEDLHTNSEVLLDLLGALGYHVECATFEACNEDYLRFFSPALTLVDLQPAPASFLARHRRVLPETKIIGCVDPGFPQESRVLDWVDATVKRPLDATVLSPLLRQVLDSS